MRIRSFEMHDFFFFSIPKQHEIRVVVLFLYGGQQLPTVQGSSLVALYVEAIDRSTIHR